MREDDGGGGDGGDYGGESSLSGIGQDYVDSMGHGGGGSGATGAHGDLWNAFIQPFTDIYDSAVLVLKTLSTEVKHVLKQALRNLEAAVIPFWKHKAHDLEQARLKEIGALQGQYAEVIQRNDKFMMDHDLWGMAFMMDPTLMLAGKVVQHSPDIAGELLGMVGVNVGGHMKESLLREDATTTNEVDESLKAKLRNHPEVKKVRAFLLHGIEADVTLLVSSMKDYNDAMFVTGGAIGKSLASIKPLVQSGQIPVKALPGVKMEVLRTTKESLIKFYVDRLTELAKMAPGVASDIEHTISKIKSLPTT